MQTLPPDDADSEMLQHSLRAIADRLVEKGWASRVLATSEVVSIELSGKGIDGMNALFAAITELDPDNMNSEHMLGLLTVLRSRKRADGESVRDI